MYRISGFDFFVWLRFARGVRKLKGCKGEMLLGPEVG